MMPAVRLVPLSATDEPEFLAAVARSTKLHRPWVMPPATPLGFRAMVKRMQEPVNLGFVIRHGAGDELAGYIDITNIVRGGFQSAYLGYYAFAGHERQGIMGQALRQTVRVAFSQLKLHRLEANIQPDNVASIALARSCGFMKEGYSPRYLKIRGRWRDHERWAILAR
jgi:[ribosomal protein S5]-alanine N-acetyltransferase